MSMAEMIPDPNGAAERPECGEMQVIADKLLGMVAGETDPERKALLLQAAEVITLQLDWLLEQHRIITQLRGGA